MTRRDPRFPREVTCPSCGLLLGNHEFRGRSNKTPACKRCEALSPEGTRWCLDCDAWVDTGDFYWCKTTQRFPGNRCKPCTVHRAHGVTRKHMAELTGHAVPQCSACGDRDRLSIDHNHAHCDKEAGCRHCVRGYLCRACNVAEGLLKSIDRAQALVNYMRANQLTLDELAALPPSPRGGRRQRASRKSSTQPHAFYKYPTAEAPTDVA